MVNLRQCWAEFAAHCTQLQSLTLSAACNISRASLVADGHLAWLASSAELLQLPGLRTVEIYARDFKISSEHVLAVLLGEAAAAMFETWALKLYTDLKVRDCASPDMLSNKLLSKGLLDTMLRE